MGEATEFWFRTEIHEQSNFESGGPKVVQNLCFVCRVELTNRLQFQQHGVLHDNIGFEIPDFETSKEYGHLEIRLNFQPRLFQGDRERYALRVQE